MLTGIILVIVIALSLLGGTVAILSRVKRCPSDQILVVYGKTGSDQNSKCIQGGTTFVWPVIQDYEYMPLTPMTININLKSALSSQQIPVDVPSTFTVAISKQPTLMQNAATRLLGLNKTSIEELASEIIFGQLRDVVAQLTIEELINDRNSFLSKISDSVESELAKIGLELINVNITDITDESGYIVALGKKAASQALNQARIEEAENNKSGEVGVSLHEKEQRTLVAENNAEAIIGEKESERKKRIATSQAEALAIKGENETAAQIEQSNADREVEIAEAQKKELKQKKHNKLHKLLYLLKLKRTVEL
jgi:flotillin